MEEEEEEKEEEEESGPVHHGSICVLDALPDKTRRYTYVQHLFIYYTRFTVVVKRGKKDVLEWSVKANKKINQ